MIDNDYEELEVLFGEESIGSRVEELAAKISRDYAGKSIVLICILKAAAVFASDLMRSLTVPCTLEFVCASSYGSGTAPAAQDVEIVRDLPADLAGRHILLVDTIADSGRTLAALVNRCWERGPASVRTAVLLDKRARRTSAVHLDYVGFEVPNRFVVGYGMDRAERYRNLPYIAVVKEDVPPPPQGS